MNREAEADNDARLRKTCSLPVAGLNRMTGVRKRYIFFKLTSIAGEITTTDDNNVSYDGDGAHMTYNYINMTQIQFIAVHHH